MSPRLTPAFYTIGSHPYEAPPLESGLYLVATPIGHLGDVTLRALATLAAADLLLCEDTRVTRKLLERYGIRTRTLAYHDHNAAVLQGQLLDRLKSGEALALVSDAGMPLVSDPGERLVRACAQDGIRITIIPGASASLSALALSALPPVPFTFLGFLPVKKAARARFLEQALKMPATLICFESPHRLAESLQDIAALAADRDMTVTRELTKLYEEVKRGSAQSVASEFSNREVKGEITIVIGPALEKAAALSEDQIDSAIKEALQRLSAAKAASELAKSLGLPRKDIYARILAQKG